MIDDCWHVVASFCDIKERGRLFSSIKYIYKNWKDLSEYYLNCRTPNILEQYVKRKWDFLKKYTCIMNNTLSLKNGLQMSCWSPFCLPDQLYITRKFAMVQFFTCHNIEHGRFITWVRKLAQTKFNTRLLEPNKLTAYYKWKQIWRLPIKNKLEPVMLPIRPFRVRVFMHGLPFPRIERGMLILRIVEFEFKSK